MLPGEVGERPPDFHPSLVAESGRVECLEGREQTVPVGDRQAVDVVGQVVPAARVLLRVRDGARQDLGDSVEQLGVCDRRGLDLSPRTPPRMVREGTGPATEVVGRRPA